MEAVTNPTTMTLDELRDWCAVDDGWEFRSSFGNHWWVRVADGGMDETSEHHPYPATIDGAARALPEGWWWSRCETEEHGKWWYAGRHKGFASVDIPDTGDEILDRYRLAVACRMAMKGA